MKYTQILFILAFVLLAGCISTPIPSQNSTTSLIPLSVQCPQSNMAQVQSNFAAAISASGGSGNYQFQITGQLPYGLLTNGQVINGRPGPNTQGNYSYVATAIDSLNQTDSETCLLTVNQTIFACNINGQVPSTYYTNEDCQRGCADPASCAVWNPPAPSGGSGNTLLTVAILILAAAAFFLVFFGDVIGQPEGVHLIRTRGQIEYKDRQYNCFKDERTDRVTGELTRWLSHTKRAGTDVFLSSREHALSLRSLDRHNPVRRIVEINPDTSALKARIAQLEGAYAALFDQHTRATNTDIMGYVVAQSAHFKTVGDNAIHTSTFMPMTRSGQTYKGQGEAPPDY